MQVVSLLLGFKTQVSHVYQDYKDLSNISPRPWLALPHGHITNGQGDCGDRVRASGFGALESRTISNHYRSTVFIVMLLLFVSPNNDTIIDNDTSLSTPAHYNRSL